jgi:hypothetical protein
MMNIEELNQLLKLNESLIIEALINNESRARLQELVFHKIEVMKCIIDELERLRKTSKAA